MIILITIGLILIVFIVHFPIYRAYQAVKIIADERLNPEPYEILQTFKILNRIGICTNTLMKTWTVPSDGSHIQIEYLKRDKTFRMWGHGTSGVYHSFAMLEELAEDPRVAAKLAEPLTCWDK